MGKIRQVDIAIVGTGIVGLALAVSLAQSTPFKVLLIGARPKETEDGHRVSALNVASQTMLTKLGVWAQLAGHVAAYDQMKIYEQSAQLPSLWSSFLWPTLSPSMKKLMKMRHMVFAVLIAREMSVGFVMALASIHGFQEFL